MDYDSDSETDRWCVAEGFGLGRGRGTSTGRGSVPIGATGGNGAGRGHGRGVCPAAFRQLPLYPLSTPLLGIAIGRGRGRGVNPNLLDHSLPPTPPADDDVIEVDDISSNESIGQRPRPKPEPEKKKNKTSNEVEILEGHLEKDGVKVEAGKVAKAPVPRMNEIQLLNAPLGPDFDVDRMFEDANIVGNYVWRKAYHCALPKYQCRVIVKGIDLLNPYIELKAFPLIELVEAGIKTEKIDQINRLQRAAWPHILRGRNCFIVGGLSSRSGKTLAYLVPIAAKVLKDVDILRKESSAKGPAAIILCSGRESAQKIQTHLQILVGKNVTTYHGSRAEKFLLHLSQNPEFLICRPDFLLFLLEKHPELLSLDRLRYLVVDDSHILQVEQMDSLNAIFASISHTFEKLGNRKWPLQFVFCGDEWNTLTKEACSESSPFNDPVLIISSFTQALVYGNVKLHIAKADNDQDKLLRIAEIIRCAKLKSSVVVCQSREVAMEVGNFLFSTKEIASIYYEENANLTASEQFARMARFWHNRCDVQPTALITTDVDLLELEVNAVTTIIHYDMPTRAADVFGERHVCMWNFFDYGEEVELISYIFLTPNDPELVEVVGFMKTLNAIVEPELEKKVDEETKPALEKAELCDGIRVLGTCNAKDKKKCMRKNRHFFTKNELEAESTVPKFKDARVELTIMETIGPNQYIAVVESFYQVKNGLKTNEINFVVARQKLNSVMNGLYNQKRHRVPVPFLGDPSLSHSLIGRLCVIKYSMENPFHNYARAKIIAIYPPSYDGGANGVRVRLNCVDLGGYQIRKPEEVYECHPMLCPLVPFTARVIIAGLKPIGNEEEYWANWRGFKETELDFVYRTLTGPVSLSVGNTIWVSNLCEFTKYQDGSASGAWIKQLDLRTEFIRKRKIAEENPNHIVNLYKLCEEAGYDCTLYRTVEDIGREFQTILDPYQWAHLETSTSENPELIPAVLQSIGPDQIYIVKYKFNHLIYEMMGNLDEEVRALINGRHSDYATKFMNHYEKGLCVAVKISDSGLEFWSRGIIDEMPNPSNGNKYRVFFADFGQRADVEVRHIFPIPKKFVEILPFQVISISLNHIDIGTASDLVQKKLRSLHGPRVDVVALKKVTRMYDYDPDCIRYAGYVIPTPELKPDSDAIGQATDELGELLVTHGLATRADSSTGLWEAWLVAKAAILRRITEQVEKELNKGDESDENEDDDMDNTDVENSFPMPFVDHNYFGWTDQEIEVDGKKFSVFGGYSATTSGMLDTLESMGVDTSEIYKVAEKSPVANKKAEVSKPPGANAKAHTAKGNNDCEDLNLRSPVDFGLIASGEAKKVPRVFWRQTKTHIVLTVNIVDIKEYKLNIEENERAISFESLDPPNYQFKISLWGDVMSPGEEKLFGRYFIIKLEKVFPGKWEHVARKCPRWLCAEYIDDDSDSDLEDEWGICNDVTEVTDASHIGAKKDQEKNDKAKANEMVVVDNLKFLEASDVFAGGRNNGQGSDESSSSDDEIFGN